MDTFAHPLAQSSGPLPVEALPHYWYPQRFGVEYAPVVFRHELHELFTDVDCTWMPLDERWLVWQREPTVTHHLCPGWSLKRVWEDGDGDYLPLDARLFAELYRRQLFRYDGAGRGYFDRVCNEIQRERDATQRSTDSDSFALRQELIRSRRITNIGRGNKFSLHHDGTIIPTRSELNWRRELTRNGRDPI